MAVFFSHINIDYDHDYRRYLNMNGKIFNYIPVIKQCPIQAVLMLHPLDWFGK